MLKKLKCFFLKHKWKLIHVKPPTKGEDGWFNKLRQYIDADYDLYKECERCEKRVGVGQRYD